MWHNVLAGNQLHAWAPLVPPKCDASTGGGTLQQSAFSEPGQAAPRLELYPLPPRRVPTRTSALTIAAWLEESPAEIQALLPIVLGSLNGCGKPVGGSVTVTTAAQAKLILAGGKKNAPAKDQLESELRAELLAAKLNLAYASSTGASLSTAFVKGSRASVAGAVESADQALARTCPGLVCPHELGCGVPGPLASPPGKGGANSASADELKVATTLLRLINARKVEYRQ